MVCGAGRYRLTGRSPLPHAIAAALLVAGCGGSAVPAASASQSGIQALPGASRSLSAPVNGSNLDYSGVAQPFSAPSVVAALTALRPGTLRYPGGAIANYWQWQTGTLVEPPQTVANGNGGRKNQPGQTHTYGFTLETLRSIVRETGTTPVFDLNVLTSTLADQLAMLKAASAYWASPSATSSWATSSTCPPATTPACFRPPPRTPTWWRGGLRRSRRTSRTRSSPPSGPCRRLRSARSAGIRRFCRSPELTSPR